MRELGQYASFLYNRRRVGFRIVSGSGNCATAGTSVEKNNFGGPRITPATWCNNNNIIASRGRLRDTRRARIGLRRSAIRCGEGTDGGNQKNEPNGIGHHATVA